MKWRNRWNIVGKNMNGLPGPMTFIFFSFLEKAFWLFFFYGSVDEAIAKLCEFPANDPARLFPPHRFASHRRQSLIDVESFFGELNRKPFSFVIWINVGRGWRRWGGGERKSFAAVIIEFSLTDFRTTKFNVPFAFAAVATSNIDMTMRRPDFKVFAFVWYCNRVVVDILPQFAAL